MSETAVNAKAAEYLIHIVVQLIILIIGIRAFTIAESAREKVEKIVGQDKTPAWCELAELFYIACVAPFPIGVALLAAGRDPLFLTLVRSMTGLAVVFVTAAVWLHYKTEKLTHYQHELDLR